MEIAMEVASPLLPLESKLDRSAPAIEVASSLLHVPSKPDRSAPSMEVASSLLPVPSKRDRSARAMEVASSQLPVPSKLHRSTPAIEVQVLSSKLVKPAASTDAAMDAGLEYVPLSAFDRVTYQIQMAIIYVFAPPAPSTAALEKGLAAALAKYRVFAGQLVVRGEAPGGGPAVLLNDHGARVVEASVDADLVDVAPPMPKPELLWLHPNLEEGMDEVVVLQLTRFRCGSLAVGFTANHAVTDGRGTSNFLVDWGRATRGVAMGLPPVYNHDELFKPRSVPRVEFDHRNREYYLPTNIGSEPAADDVNKNSIVIHKAHFTKDWIARLRASASEGRDRPFSRFQSILAHLWRATTRARGLRDNETSTIRLSVDGRDRLGVPAEYAGNLVLWAFPQATAGDLLNRPLKHAAQAIHDEVARVADADYFRSFLDFTSSGAVEEEGLAPSAALNLREVLCPDLEVHSWLTFPFYDLDFGTGTPSYVMPSYFPAEGLIFLMPSYIGDGSVDAFVPVFQRNLEAFKQCVYRIDLHE